MTNNADHKAEATADLSEDPNPQSSAESQETDTKEELRKRRAEKREKHAHGASAMEAAFIAKVGLIKQQGGTPYASKREVEG